MIRIALIGAGQRGNIYGRHVKDSDVAELVAIVEPNEQRRELAAEEYALDPSQVFANTTDFFAKGRIADALILANMDRDHYGDAMQALSLGYDMLLEKPISPDPAESLDIQRKADQMGCKVIVCHVLRYTAFFSTIKRLVDSGELGKIITIQHNENIGNFHMAHSFVRGNWSRSDESSSLIMQKSCHDMDILTWLTGSEARRIASFGSLRYFKEENAPVGSGCRCLDCKVSEACRFDARKAYLPIRGSWPATVVSADQTETGLLKALEESPYGRCVYRCDNDVCDNQVTLIEFKNGVTVSFNLSGFTSRISRTLKIMCEHGEIRGDDYLNQIEVIRFVSNNVQQHERRIIVPELVDGGHGGGDTLLMEDFLAQLQSKSPGNDSRSSIKQSVESHIMSNAAEASRISGSTVDVDIMKRQIFESLREVEGKRKE